MVSYTQEQVWQKYHSLHQELKSTIWAEETSDLLHAIAQKHNVVGKVSALARVTGRVLIGIIPLQKYRAAIQAELGISEDQAREIAYEVRDKLFMRIAQHLQSLHNIPSGTNPASAAAPPAPVPVPPRPPRPPAPTPPLRPSEASREGGPPLKPRTNVNTIDLSN